MESSEPAKPWKRKLRNYFLLAIIPFLICMGILTYLQTSMIFPGADTQGTPAARFSVPAHAELVDLKTASGESVVGLYGATLDADGNPREDAPQLPTLLFFYGNGMCLADMREDFQLFRRLGANCLFPEYVGYGLSSGKPSEAGCYETADAAFAWLSQRPEVDRRKIIVGGWSLGAAVAVDLAARNETAGLVMFSAFTSMVDMGKSMFPFMPVQMLLVHRFDSLTKIAQVKCPTLIAHGMQDDIVPYSMSQRLAAAAGGHVTNLPIPKVQHNDFMINGHSQIKLALSALFAEVAAGK